MRLYTLITFIQQILNDVKTSIHIYVDSRLIFLGKLINLLGVLQCTCQCITIPYFSLAPTSWKKWENRSLFNNNLHCIMLKLTSTVIKHTSKFHLQLMWLCGLEQFNFTSIFLSLKWEWYLYLHYSFLQDWEKIYKNLINWQVINIHYILSSLASSFSYLVLYLH